MKAKVSEIFFSVQGEGSFVGIKAIFIRLCGCNLNCYFCDTKYALNCNNPLNANEIFSQIKDFKTKNIIFTGGEPALQDDFMAYFMGTYRKYNYFLETNGTIFPAKSIKLFKHIVVSPKLFAINMDTLRKIKDEARSVEFKFVVEENFEEEIKIAKQLKLKRITLQPLWFKDTAESYLQKTKRIIEKAKKIDMELRIVPQMHKILYGEKRGI